MIDKQRYEVVRDGTHTGRDWLNRVTMRFPYVIRHYYPGQEFPFGRIVGVAPTRKAADRKIKKDQVSLKTRRDVLYETEV